MQFDSWNTHTHCRIITTLAWLWFTSTLIHHNPTDSYQMCHFLSDTKKTTTTTNQMMTQDGNTSFRRMNENLRLCTQHVFTTSSGLDWLINMSIRCRCHPTFKPSWKFFSGFKIEEWRLSLWRDLWPTFCLKRWVMWEKAMNWDHFEQKSSEPCLLLYQPTFPLLLHRRPEALSFCLVCLHSCWALFKGSITPLAEGLHICSETRSTDSVCLSVCLCFKQEP